MKASFVKCMIATLTVAAMGCLAPCVAWAEKPHHVTVRESLRDLTIELRQVKEGEERQTSPAARGYTVGTANRPVDFLPQQVRVRSGEKATLQIQQSIPMQWVQKLEAQSASLSAASASASSNAGGITQALTWLEAGQSFQAIPHWSGGKNPVKLEIEVQSSAVDERTSADLPKTTRQRYSTTVTAPMNQWVTIAASGRSASAGSYSSGGSSEHRRLVQIRVTAE